MSVEHDQMMVREKSRLNKWTQGAFASSVAIHIVFLVAAAFIVALKSFHKPQAVFQSEPPTRPRMEQRKLEMKVKVEDLQKRSSRPKLQPRMLAMAPSAVSLPDIKTPPKPIQRKVKRNYATVGVSGFGSGIGGGLGTGFGGGMGGGLPTILSGRCSKSDRLSRLRGNGGKKESEEAVVKGLRYLQGTQNADGSWGGGQKGAMTGLALLAFLGHCETHRSPEFGKTVKKGIDFLVKTGRDNDGLLAPGSHHGYAHGIATYALAESYSLCKISSIPPVLKDSVKIIVDTQNSDGGWYYRYASQMPSDTSVTGWQVQALKAAQTTGKTYRGLTGAMDSAMDYLKNSQNGAGHIGYRGNSGHRWVMTGIGTFGLQMGKKGNTSAAKKGVDAFLSSNPRLDYKGGSCNLYGWYYCTMSAFQKGGSDWKKWNGMFQDQVLANQDPDGSWSVEGGGGTDKHGKGDGSIYRACLNILMLEVYYRYLPATG